MYSKCCACDGGNSHFEYRSIPPITRSQNKRKLQELQDGEVLAIIDYKEETGGIPNLEYLGLGQNKLL